jgi:hypothetical protein
LFLWIKDFKSSKTLHLLLVPFFLVTIYEFSQLNLEPIHNLISLLNLIQRLLLVRLHKDLQEHLHLFIIPILPLPILLQIF